MRSGLSKVTIRLYRVYLVIWTVNKACDIANCENLRYVA